MKRFSFLIATLNSEKTLGLCLESVRNQDYPQDLVEIMVIDGGSRDNTRALALKHGCRIIENPDVVPVSAKLIGLKEAKGDYLIHLDSDEVLLSRHALRKRLAAFMQNPKVVMLFGTGYQSPPGSPFVNNYINEFGDPFSMYYYRLSKDHRFQIPELRSRYPVTNETSDYLVFDVAGRQQPIMENAALANAIDLKFFRTHFSDLCEKPWGPVHFFYHMQKLTSQFAVTKDDAVMHFSADHWMGFLRKIDWRVRNNIFSQKNLGSSGFSGRVGFDPFGRRIKKYLYLPYALLLIPSLLDSLYLAFSRRDWRYLGHLPLTLITAFMILIYFSIRALGFRPEMKSYGGKLDLGPS